jgi:hypothetical protein
MDFDGVGRPAGTELGTLGEVEICDVAPPEGEGEGGLVVNELTRLDPV